MSCLPQNNALIAKDMWRLVFIVRAGKTRCLYVESVTQKQVSFSNNWQMQHSLLRVDEVFDIMSIFRDL